MSTTILDIARKLNISPSTVSKALNGYEDVAMATRNLVQETASQLGYQPSAAARNLRLGRTDKIGLFLNTTLEYVADYISGIIPGAVTQAHELGKNLLIYTIYDNDPNQLLKVCRAGEVDGVILFSTVYDSKILDILLRENFPFIIMGRAIRNKDVSFIAPDYYTGSYDATQYLIDLGHRRIALMTRPELLTANEARLKGYFDALQDNGIEPDDSLIVETQIQPKSGVKPTELLLELDELPTAIFAFHDLVAVDVINVLQSRGFRVPQDICVMGFDGLKAGLMTNPQITTIQQPLHLIGKRVIEIINHKIDDTSTPPIQETVPVELVVRGSCTYR